VRGLSLEDYVPMEDQTTNSSVSDLYLEKHNVKTPNTLDEMSVRSDPDSIFQSRKGMDDDSSMGLDRDDEFSEQF
jgi:hypothetical protein